MIHFFLLKGFVLGFSIAAPVGPIGLLCINKTMNNGKLSGFLSGLGAASADMLYGCIAAFGLNSISNLLIDKSYIIKLIGGLFMCYLGLKIFFSSPNSKTLELGSKKLLGDYSSTFFLTITNPMTILSFIAVFAGLGLANAHSTIGDSVLLVAGVFFGSALWWFLLCYCVEFINKKSNGNFMPIINKISGLVILGFGIVALRV